MRALCANKPNNTSALNVHVAGKVPCHMERRGERSGEKRGETHRSQSCTKTPHPTLPSIRSALTRQKHATTRGRLGHLADQRIVPVELGKILAPECSEKSSNPRTHTMSTEAQAIAWKPL